MALAKVERWTQEAIADARAGRADAAEAGFRRALEADPDFVPALGNLGALLQYRGRVVPAAECFRRICQLEPANVHAFISFGVCLGMLNRLPEALAIFREAVKIDPANAIAWSNLAKALLELGELEEAEQAVRKALALHANEPTSMLHLAAILNARARHDEALPVAEAVVRLRPDAAEAHCQLGIALRGRRRMAEAFHALMKATELRPNYPEATSALAMLMGGFGGSTQAMETIEKALAASPKNADLHNAAGYVLHGDGRLGEAIPHYRRAFELNPHLWAAGSNMLLAMHYLDDADPKVLCEEHVAWGKRHATAVSSASRPQHRNNREENRPLRLAYISPDFRYHSVAHFLRPIIERHDRQQFDIVCYSGVAVPDAWTQAFQQMGVTWRDSSRWNDARLAGQIHADAVDIAIDCSGHTSAHRLLALAHRPAPVQVTFLGYPNTTGVGAIDYRITDSIADPPGEADALYVEKLVRLDPTAWCYAAPGDAPDVIAQREPGGIRFGAFTARPKLTERWMGIWSKILTKVPGSKLLLKTGGTHDTNAAAKLVALFTAHGIDADRIELIHRQQNPADHLATYNRVDIALDTFPYHGTTTTCEAMYMGVPVITRCGRMHASRVGVSLLSAIGLNELIAEDDEAFVQIAVKLAKDEKRLAELHATLRERMKASPLMDGAAYVARLEAAYREMWRAWCRSGATAAAQ